MRDRASVREYTQTGNTCIAVSYGIALSTPANQSVLWFVRGVAELSIAQLWPIAITIPRCTSRLVVEAIYDGYFHSAHRRMGTTGYGLLAQFHSQNPALAAIASMAVLSRSPGNPSTISTHITKQDVETLALVFSDMPGHSRCVGADGTGLYYVESAPTAPGVHDLAAVGQLPGYQGHEDAVLITFK